jgi:hypothetical protein
LYILCYEKAMEMLQMFDDTEKSTLTEECHMVVFSFLLTTNSDRQEHFTKHQMLAIYILYVMHKWSSRAFKPVKYNLLSVTDALQHIQASPKLIYTVHYKKSSCIPVTFRLCSNSM